MKHLLLIGGILLAVIRTQAQTATAYSGRVLETTNAGSYTYVLVDVGAKKVWAAANEFEVKTGDTVTFTGGDPMPNFHSKAMNRDFAEIYFVSDMSLGAAKPAAKLPPGHPDLGGGAGGLPKNHPPLTGQAPATVDVSNIKPATGGKTIAEIFAGQAQLNGQAVIVRGKVVKYNSGIMGKNWIHIQDGTGQPGSNDLLVTSQAEAKKGDTILVTGKIATQKNFGAGYKYAVLVEDASVVVE